MKILLGFAFLFAPIYLPVALSPHQDIWRQMGLLFVQQLFTLFCFIIGMAIFTLEDK